MFCLIRLVIYFTILYATNACKCGPKSNFTQAFCEADWVSHVSVNSNNTTDDGHWLRYDVKHIEVFKSSVDPLPGFVLTPPSSATCGITDLVNNNEYLMAGTVANGIELHIYSCLYIPMKDGEFNDEIGALQWKKVPLAIQQKLSSTTNSTCT